MKTRLYIRWFLQRFIKDMSLVSLFFRPGRTWINYCRNIVSHFLPRAYKHSELERNVPVTKIGKKVVFPRNRESQMFHNNVSFLYDFGGKVLQTRANLCKYQNNMADAVCSAVIMVCSLECQYLLKFVQYSPCNASKHAAKIE